NQDGAAAHGVGLVSRSSGYQIETPPELVDVHRFRTLLHQATGTDPATRRGLLRDALALWRGPALDRAASGLLRQRLCADLDEMRLHATEEELAAGLELGRDGEVLPELARLAAEHPARERLVELHMLTLYRAGR